LRLDKFIQYLSLPAAALVQGCDASVLLKGADDERSAGPDATLSPDALDLIGRAKAAVDGDPRCAGKVSCADVLALATRDVVSQVVILYWYYYAPPRVWELCLCRFGRCLRLVQRLIN
jgi:hypothetical protein